MIGVNMITQSYNHVIKVGAKPKRFKCHASTAEDASHIESLQQEGHEERIAETIACENHFGFVYSMGVDKYAPGCGKCSCCKPRRSGKLKLYIKVVYTDTL